MCAHTSTRAPEYEKRLTNMSQNVITFISTYAQIFRKLMIQQNVSLFYIFTFVSFLET